MNDIYAFRNGFLSRLTDLAERDGMVKQAGPLRALTSGIGKRLGSFMGGGANVAKNRATQTFLEQQLAQRQVQTAALQNRLQGMVGGPTQVQMAGGGPFPKAPGAAPAAAPSAPLPGAAPASVPTSAMPDAAPSPMSALQGRIGKSVAGMEPGLMRRVLAGSQFANANPLNPADLGKAVTRRAGGAALGAGALGASNVYGQYQAAEEAKRRAAQSSFMQRLAFLMNPNLVYQM